MNKINLKIMAVVLGTVLISANSQAENDQLELFPILKDNWDADLAVSATAGYMDIGNSVAGGGSTYGFQVAFNCPVFTIPGKNVILQQISMNFYDNNNLELTTLEINPHYFWQLSDELRLGIGPGLGYVWTDTKGGKDPDLWAGQAGFAVEYRNGNLYANFGSRYQWTESARMGKNNKKDDMDNLLTTFKIGYNF